MISSLKCKTRRVHTGLSSDEFETYFSIPFPLTPFLPLIRLVLTGFFVLLTSLIGYVEKKTNIRAH